MTKERVVVMSMGMVFVLGCARANPGSGASEAPASAPAASPPPASAETSTPTVAARSAPEPLGPFVRKRPESQPSGVDACAYRGFLGFACVDAIIAESDPVKRRYMRRLSDAAARIEKDNREKNEWGGVAHAEIIAGCGTAGPCGRAIPDWAAGKPDDGYACLTKAEALLNESKKATKESTQAHARACQCDPVRAQIPVMGGVLACDGPGKPVEHGTQLELSVALSIIACGWCDPDGGPKACTSEIERLKKDDAKLAAYVENTHAPRCQRP